MRRLLLLLPVVVVIFIGLLSLFGISPSAVPEAMRLGTGLSAKLACSGHYLSGFSDEQNLTDIATYSPATRLVSVHHADNATVEANIAGAFGASARYYPGLGCTLQFPGMVPLDTITVPATTQRDGRWPLGDDTGPLDPLLQLRLEQMVAQDGREGLDTRALLVVQHGEIAAESYAPDIERDTPLLGWSMGKSVTALMVGRLEALELLSTEESRLFAEWVGDPREDISVNHLLQMSSGLDFYEPYVPGSDSTRMLFLSPSAAEVALESELAHPPGSYFYYSSGTTNLLARLVYERLGRSTQSLVDFFTRELAEPMGLRDTTLELDASGVFVGSSYIYAPARDWARMALPMLQDGRSGTMQLLPRGWVARATAPNDSANDPRYGYQFWLNGGGAVPRWPALPEGAFSMSGNRGQSVMILPSVEAIIVRLGWTAGDYPVNERFGELHAQLQARFTGRGAE